MIKVKCFTIFSAQKPMSVDIICKPMSVDIICKPMSVDIICKPMSVDIICILFYSAKEKNKERNLLYLNVILFSFKKSTSDLSKIKIS